MLFRDRKDAGKQLAPLLEIFRGKAVVFGLPRGGVIVARQVADYLKAPLSVIVVRKIGHPAVPEMALGAVAVNGHRVMEPSLIPDIDTAWLEHEAERQQTAAKVRYKLYRPPPVQVKNKVAILVDDGVATGFTMKTAVLEISHRNPSAIVIAVPVCPGEFRAEMEKKGYVIVAYHIPDRFERSVSAYYQSFPQVSDAEVMETL